MIELRAVSKTVTSGSEPLTILHPLTTQIPRGQFVAIVGPSGSGKSTLLGLIAGLDAPTSGSVIIDGVDITRLDEDGLARLRGEKIGFVFQFFHLIPSLTAHENVAVPMEIAGVADAAERASIQQVLAEKGFVRGAETTYRRADGSILHTLLSATVMRARDGTELHLGVLRDITERKRAEDAMRAASLHARSLIEAALDPLVTISPAGTITDVNQATEDVTGVSRAELISRTGIAAQMLSELEQLGMVTSRPPGWFDADAVIIVEAVVGLSRYGLEVRHLRAFRTGADRQVGLFAQLLAPVVRQNDPAAQARAAETARELTALSQRLHAALVRTGLRETLGR